MRQSTAQPRGAILVASGPLTLRSTESDHKQMSDRPPALYTLGYQGLNIDEFIGRLNKHSIDDLVDVRKNPIPRKPGFSKRRLSETLADHSIRYHHLPDLGIPSSKRRNLDIKRPSTYDSLFAMYEKTILPRSADSVAFVQLLAKTRRVALTCFEADHRFCHRSILSRHIAIQSNAMSVFHL